MDWWFDPARTYGDNVAHGPFGDFARPTPASPQSRVQDQDQDRGAASSRINADGPQPTLFGQTLRSPFGIAAGPLPTARHCAAAFDHGFDVNVYKTVRSRAVEAHPFPNTLAVRVEGDLPGTGDVTLTADSDFATASSISNSYGVPSLDPDVWQPDMAVAVDSAGEGQLLVGSFQGTRDGGGEAALIADFAHTAALVAATGARVLEMNLSCPNEGTTELVCFDPSLAARIAHAVRERVADRALIVKVAYFPDDRLLAQLVTKLAPVVDGIAAVNTLPARLVDQAGYQALAGKGRQIAGVCGAGIRWAGLDMTRRLVHHRQQLGSTRQEPLAIIGVGGVATAADYLAYRDAGASAVMAATGAMRNAGLGVAVRSTRTAPPRP